MDKNQSTSWCCRVAVAALLLWAVVLFPPFLVGANEWSPLIEKLHADGFEKKALEELFSRSALRFDPEPMSTKITVLMNRSTPPRVGKEMVRRKVVYNRYLRTEVLKSAQVYLRTNGEILSQVSREYCVPREVIVSIMLIETNLGHNTGKRKAFNVLSSMALCDDLEKIRPYIDIGVIHEGNELQARQRCREKSAWAYNELKYLLKYSNANSVDPLSIPGSIYGAIGLCQFMPSNIFLYGIDADGKGRIDLFSTPDALHSIGNYLHRNGWKCRMERNQRRRIVMTYNHSQIYANTVLALADRLQAMNKKKNRRL